MVHLDPGLPQWHAAPQYRRVLGYLNLLTASTFVTWIGTRISAVALPLVALEQTGDPWTTGLVGGVAGLPLLTSGWWGSRIRPRLRSGRGLAALLLLEALGVAIVPVAALTIGVDALVLCASGLVAGVGMALHPPAQRAITGDLADAAGAELRRHNRQVPPRLAARALAWQDLAHRISMLFAPALGAGLLVAWGAVPLLWAQALALAISAGVVALIPQVHPPTPTDPDGPRSSATASRAGPELTMREVLGQRPQLAAAIALATVGGLTWFAFSLGLALLGVEWGRPGELIAAGMTGYGLTTVAVSAITPALVARLPLIPVTLLCWVVLGASFVALAWVAPSLIAIGAVSAIGGICMPLGIAALNALIIEQTDSFGAKASSARHTAFTAQTIGYTGGASTGLLLGGFVIGWFGAGPALIGAGILQILAPAAAALWLRRHRASTVGGETGLRRVPRPTCHANGEWLDSARRKRRSLRQRSTLPRAGTRRR